MQLLDFLTALLATATAVSAAPAPLSDNVASVLSKRAPIQPVSCGPSTDQRAWSLQVVQNAFNGFDQYGNLPDAEKPKAGDRAYPRQYGGTNATPSDATVIAALDAIPECHTGQIGFKFFEFPITDPPFVTGPAESQGPDRVIAISPNIGPGGTRTYTYCLSISHRGHPMGDPAFDPCTNVP